MNKANECTCPSGDGSLVHPCPAHPAVEQAGGDERAAFDAYRDRRNALLESEGHKPGSKWHVTNAHYPTWEASRAALAQPSQKCATCNGTGLIDDGEITCSEGGIPYENGPVKCVKDCPDCKAQPSPAPELERPEGVAYLFVKPDGTLSMDAVRHKPSQPAVAVMTVAQHDRIVGELRSDRDSWAEQAEQRLADWDEMRKERDAALARVAELEKQERPEGPTEDELEAAGLGYPLHKEEAVKLWYSGFRSEVITVLEAWEAIGHDIGMNPDKGELLDSLRYMLEKCEAHDAALARVAELERQQPVAWMHDQPNRVDVIHRDVKDLLQRVPGSSRGIYRPLDVSEHYTIPLYAAPVAQAQHSVPEGVTIERDVAGTIHIKVGDFDFIQLQYQRPYTDNASTWKLAERIASLLAAAPGTEVPQAWLDVQAERRRQITAEGWTPDHDDLYCAAELPRAAAAYILSGANDEAPAIWPFSAKWWKPRDARANYMRAGALILAEIERLDRAAERGKEVGHE
ncbi:hypothetical protein [Pseudomonas aeruginosa]|uniref:hypothetical protein n=2 Tax=Pseudomonas aeruginosa TaxID=287 RepID=UPI001EF06911|nr:hypothetical protein [Pseudomonas aeruginosa]